ncbi:Swt1 family HEPN domain-containing protein [Bradyrhizobium sp. HKCCYLS2038]|uniref:Swt1 family HEPN domain-containing protein n=1 Tax=unclassified Bradyrhizobium TaxID=2631580 RepID=UPI003EBA2FA4
MLESGFEQQRDLNAKAFELLYEIEVILRELCAKKLEDSHGRHWAKRGLPPDILPKIKSAITYEQKTRWHRATLHHPLYYIDFPDLKKIVIGGNWNPIFSEIFSSRSGTEAALSDLELLRNQVAHNRFVSAVDMNILRGIHSKLLQSISPNDLNAARNAANKRVPILALLDELRRKIIGSVHAMKGALALPGEEAPDSALLDEWWFDSTYLDHDIGPLKEFTSLCTDYSMIPKGLGQAMYRRMWVSEHKAAEIGDRACTIMFSIQEKAAQIYE